MRISEKTTTSFNSNLLYFKAILRGLLVLRLSAEIFESPKSVSFSRPSIDINMLSGLMSLKPNSF